ncbi:MAG TPA: undecaprenyldiphospho-muramoylpentapeptide beta-N-acetylglucosaminyltransferase [Candidatus Dormibacteraeota bacterium]|nr:undecaprenyldiphospho-muramoylpentapeptide beta-N-acetylglucosaminyltransferase [Candidatus Dormibacteraeota bacterium]
MKLLVAGGGTGGHVFPALAVAREWRKRAKGREVVIVGTERGFEARLAPAAGLPLETLRVGGLKGIGGARLARHLALLPLGMWDALSILRRHRFCAALGLGGYASGPMILAAALAGVPSVVFEPNVQPGFTNRVLARLARRLAVAHEETAALWGPKAVVTGCPVRDEFFDVPETQSRSPLRVLVTGGSQGSQAINRAMTAALDRLAARKGEFSVVHQTGEKDLAEVRREYERHTVAAEVRAFLDDMPARFAAADLIVCRSGAITVAEVCAAGRAALFIPFGAATDSHQMSNAREMERAGAGRVIAESELTGERLAGEILSLIGNGAALREMARRARTLGRPRASAAIVDLLEGVARP